MTDYEEIFIQVTKIVIIALANPFALLFMPEIMEAKKGEMDYMPDKCTNCPCCKTDDNMTYFCVVDDLDLLSAQYERADRCPLKIAGGSND